MTTPTLEQRIVAFAQAVGADVKAGALARGDLSALTTTAKTSLVAAINELVLLMADAGNAVIDDSASSGGLVTWSVDKVKLTIAAATAAIKDELTDGAGAALDTLAELGAAINNNPSFAAEVASQIAARVRFDAAQTLTTAQKTQACANIGAAELIAIGNPDRDLAAVYAAAKA